MQPLFIALAAPKTRNRRGLFWTGALQMLAGGWCCLQATAQSPSEPVEQIRITLNGSDQSPAEREKSLRVQARRLNTLQEVRLALELAEWLGPDNTSPNASSDGRVRAELVVRLSQGYRDILAGKDLVTRGQLLATLAERTHDQNTARGVLDACSSLAELLGLVAAGTDPDQGCHAIELLGRVPVPPGSLLHAYEGALLPNSPMRRLAVAQSLDELIRHSTQGTRVKKSLALERVVPLTPLVVTLCGDEQVRVRRAALDTAQRLSQLALQTIRDEQIVPAGVPESSRPEVHAAARRLVMDLAAKICVCLRDPDAEARLRAQRCLDDLLHTRDALRTRSTSGGDPLAKVLPGCLITLSEALRDPEPKVRRAALAVLENLGADAAPCSASLVEALYDPDAFVRWGAIRAVTNLGPAIVPEGPARIRLRLEDEDADVRAAAEGALRRLRD